MISQVTSGFVRLNGRFFDEDKLLTNKHQLSLEEKVSYPTVHKYFKEGSDIRNVSGEVLYAILIRGMGYSVEDARELRLGDVFEFVTQASETTQ